MVSTKKYGFSKDERLSSRKQIDQLFQEGEWINGKYLRLIYKQEETELQATPKILIAVPKKLFKRAVARNTLKRRIREAYRLNKHDLLKASERYKYSLHIGFIYKSDMEAGFVALEADLINLLFRLLKKLAAD